MSAGSAVWFGVLPVQDGFVKLSRSDPPNSFPPDFVIVLTTPPVKRPYSAEIPPVRMVVSWMASSMNRLCGCPRRFSPTTTPLTRKRLSDEAPPAIENPRLALSARPASPGATPAASDTAFRMFLCKGSSLTSCAVMLVVISVVSSAAGAVAVTVMASATEETLRSASTRAVWARPTLTRRVTVCMPSSSTRTVYSPGGRAWNAYPPVSPLIAVRTPCSAGDETVTRAPGSGLPPPDTVPPSEPVVCAEAPAALSTRATATSDVNFVNCFISPPSIPAIRPRRSASSGTGAAPHEVERTSTVKHVRNKAQFGVPNAGSTHVEFLLLRKGQLDDGKVAEG